MQGHTHGVAPAHTHGVAMKCAGPIKKKDTPLTTNPYIIKPLGPYRNNNVSDHRVIILYIYSQTCLLVPQRLVQEACTQTVH